MNHEQKMDYMEHTVMPEMRTMFQEFDGQRFAQFTCRTCHGANARDVNFHMPNGIAPLDPTAIPGMFASQDRMHVFMTQRLWPRMTEMLGAQRYNPETHQGFGCLGVERGNGLIPRARFPCLTPIGRGRNHQQIDRPFQVEKVVDHRMRLRAIGQTGALCDEIPHFGADIVDPQLRGLIPNGRDHVRFDIEGRHDA